MRTSQHNAKIGASLYARGVGSSLTKICPRCRQTKPRSEFGTRRARKNNKIYVHSKSYCPPCERASSAERGRRFYRQAQPETKKRIREVNRRVQYRRKYGVAIAEIERMKAEQCGLCAICGDFPLGHHKELFVDHDHKTGWIRGLLCERCNFALGRFRDDPRILLNAVAYLERASLRRSLVLTRTAVSGGGS